MSRRQVIVDGSNLATEGRSLPSLEQLDKAVREFIGENPDDQVTVVVDASFGHRIDPRELPTFEEAEAAGEVVSPPAGAIGRGDAFLLRIAQKTGATVLSNDSFQEFHAEHPWLFDKGRLVGGKPVPGVGWIFMDRTPVRGPKSREVVKEARRRKDPPASAARSEESETLSGAEPAGRGEVRPKLPVALKQRSKSVDRAIETATHEVVDPPAGGSRRRSRPPAEPVNEPLAFISFIASHPLGSLVDGVVFEYSSHGAFVEADGARCYVPLSAMGDPAPRSAREVMGKGEVVSLVVQALDPQRRGIELAMPGHEHLAGAPTAETVAAETVEAVPDKQAAKRAPARKAGTRRDLVSAAATPEPTATPAKPAKAAARVAKPPVAKPPVAKSPVAKSSTAPDEAEAGEAAPLKRAPRARKAASSGGSVARTSGLVEPSGIVESSGIVEPSETSRANKPATARPPAKATKATSKATAKATKATSRATAKATEEAVPATEAPVEATPSPEAAKVAVKVPAAKKSPLAPRRSAAKSRSEPPGVEPHDPDRVGAGEDAESVGAAAAARKTPSRRSATSATKAAAVSKVSAAVKAVKAVKAVETTTARSVSKKAAANVTKKAASTVNRSAARSVVKRAADTVAESAGSAKSAGSTTRTTSVGSAGSAAASRRTVRKTPAGS